MQQKYHILFHVNNCNLIASHLWHILQLLLIIMSTLLDGKAQSAGSWVCYIEMSSRSHVFLLLCQCGSKVQVIASSTLFMWNVKFSLNCSNLLYETRQRYKKFASVIILLHFFFTVSLHFLF